MAALPSGYVLRAALVSDVASLGGIEREAATLFLERAPELGMSIEYLREVKSAEVLVSAAADERLLVVATAVGMPVGFSLLVELDGHAHLEELDVLPAHGRKGLGTALVEAACSWARGRGYPSITLTTFRDVPWNAPFYLRRGFRVVEPAEWTPALASVVERERGLRIETRVVMRRDV